VHLEIRIARRPNRRCVTAADRLRHRPVTVYKVLALAVEKIEGSLKPGVFDGVVGFEGDPHGASRGLDSTRMTTSTEASEQRREAVKTIAKLDVVVRAVLGHLDVELAAEVNAHAMSCWRYSRNRCASDRLYLSGPIHRSS